MQIVSPGVAETVSMWRSDNWATPPPSAFFRAAAHLCCRIVPLPPHCGHRTSPSWVFITSAAAMRTTRSACRTACTSLDRQAVFASLHAYLL